MTKNRVIKCEECLFSGSNNGYECDCTLPEGERPDRAIAIVQKWAQEHPRKKFLMDFLEKHPNAPLRKDGAPMICPKMIGYPLQKPYAECERGCVACWNQPLEVEE